MEVRYFVKERLNARGDIQYAEESDLNGYDSLQDADRFIKEFQVEWHGGVYQYFIEAERV
jgi:hypothetical protein